MILCAGEALIDMLPEGGRWRPVPGGAALNTALWAAHLGAEVGYAGPLSTDPFGQDLRATLCGAGVDLSAAPETERPTTLAFVHLEGGDARYSFYDTGAAGRDWDRSDLPAVKADIGLFGGISLTHGRSAAALEALQAEMPLSMLDLNIRPALIGAPEAYRARLQRMMARAAIVKISDEDADWFGPLPQTSALLCRTHGAAGAEVLWPGGRLVVPAPSARVVDTIGAGDAFNAHLLAGLQSAGLLLQDRLRSLSEGELAPILRAAVAGASRSTESPGAGPEAD